MNIFNEFEEKLYAVYAKLSKQHDFPSNLDLSKCVIELPRDETHGDLACNAALVLAKPLNYPPRKLAELIAKELEKDDSVLATEIAGPGFINLRLHQSRWGQEILTILEQADAFGKNTIGTGKNINIEFVSANPTGPLHAAHARGAILGDVLSNLMAFSGYNVTREYYINDAGSQIITLSKSAYLRYCEVLGVKIDSIPSGLYPGDYLIDVGEKLASKFGDSLHQLSEAEQVEVIGPIAVELMMSSIKKDLSRLGITMDVYSSENTLVKNGNVSSAIQKLQQDGLIYKGKPEAPKGQRDDQWAPREQLLFKSKEFGDDVDRPLQKSDDSWTYFASDVAYHFDKLERTNGRLVDVLGADHSGYVKRMTAAVQAMSGEKDMLQIKQCGLVTLLDKGQPVKMSKRAGTFVTLSDVIDAVGADVMRFMMLTRRNDQPLEFDYAKVTEKSRDNPVFYVQYAHARAKSVLRQNKKPIAEVNYSVLTDIHEIRVIKQLSSWPKLVEAAVHQCEPHRIAFYLMELAAVFHGLWNAGRDNLELKFIQESDDELTLARMQLIDATALVIKSGLNLLSIDAVEEM
ncbi:MAG: arginine--tRNA ligase [Alphaproteobacteria bacterium]|nr:arginine--tRNA ligase [Alphaproteobacteria bacterium]